MVDLPKTLPPERERALETQLQDLRIRLLDCIERLLVEIEREPQRESLYAIAFTPNATLPKRGERPKVETALLVEQLYFAHAPDGERLETLLEFTVAVTEYYDIADDVVDGDVAPDRDIEAFLAMQQLLPLFVDRIGRLGLDATAFWTERARSLVAAPYEENRADPSLEAYLRIVDLQANFFGSITGLAALVADANDEAVKRAEEIGRGFYAYEQFLVDRRQYARGEDERWNLWVLATEQEALDVVRERRTAVRDRLATIPDARADMIGALLAHDLAALPDPCDEGP